MNIYALKRKVVSLKEGYPWTKETVKLQDQIDAIVKYLEEQER